MQFSIFADKYQMYFHMSMFTSNIEWMLLLGHRNDNIVRKKNKKPPPTPTITIVCVDETFNDDPKGS